MPLSPPHTRLPLTLTLQTTIPCPNQPRARYQTRRDSAYTPGSRAHGSYSNWPTPSCLPRLTDPSLPTETAVQALTQVVPQALCLLTDPGASPGGSAWCHLPLLLGPVNDKLSFQWHLSSDLLASPYLDNQYDLHPKPSRTFSWLISARTIFPDQLPWPAFTFTFITAAKIMAIDSSCLCNRINNSVTSRTWPHGERAAQALARDEGSAHVSPGSDTDESSRPSSPGHHHVARPVLTPTPAWLSTTSLRSAHLST